MAKKKQEQTTDGLPLAAFDLGSSSLKLLIAVPDASSDPECAPLRIIAADVNSRRQGYVKKGIIDNSSDASYVIGESIRLMSNKIGRMEPLPTAVTLLGGNSLHSTIVFSKRKLGHKLRISRQLLDDMREECITKVNRAKSDHPIVALEARPAFYIVDGEQTDTEPRVGDIAEDIEGIYTVFFGYPELQERMQGAFDRAGKSIEQAFARPSALIEALASEEDERMGLAIIDFGAETTSLYVYKGGEFLSTRVVPLGGQHLTADISQSGITMKSAEALKLRFGSALLPEKKFNVSVRAANPGADNILFTSDLLHEIIEARLDETLEKIFAELRQYEDQIGTVYLTGGASMLQGLTEYVQAHTSLPVEFGSHADWLTEDTDPEYYKPAYSAAVGALLLNARYRRENPGKPLPGTKVPNRPGIGTMIADLFTDQG